MSGFILTFGEDEYVESYNLSEKTVDISSVRKDAIVFQSRSEANRVAEIIGAEVRNV